MRWLLPRLKNRRELGYQEYRRFAFFPTPNKPLPRIRKVTTIDAKVEQHDAVRAGTHLDFRMKMPDGTIQDFVLVKRDDFPRETGKIIRIVRTPHHSEKYFWRDKADFSEGEYGYGSMRVVWRGKLDIIQSSPSKMEFCITDGQFRGRYAMIKSKDGWFMTRMKAAPADKYWRERMDFKNTDRARTIAYASDEYISEVKENGAHYYLIPGPKENLLISRRLSVEGNPIDRADNIPQLKYHRFPKEFWGRRIHVEIIAHNGSPSTTAGLLNANPMLSRQNQCRLAPLRAVVFDIEGEMDYLDRKDILMRDLVRHAPRIDMRHCNPLHRFVVVRLCQPRLIEVVEDNRAYGMTPKEFTDHLKARGLEGSVLKHKDGIYYDPEYPHIKDKAVDTVDLRVVGFQQGTGKHAERLGALICEDPNTGVQTKVGTGFSDYERDWIWSNKDLVENQIVTVNVNWQTDAGGYHGPRYIGFHPESGAVIKDEQGLIDFATASSEPEHVDSAIYSMKASRGWRRMR